MVDTVNVQTVFEGSKKYMVHLTSESDGTGETTVTKVDMSALTNLSNGEPVGRLDLIEAVWTVGTGHVVLEWDATTNDEMLVLQGTGVVSFETAGGLRDPQSAGSTGDIVLSTNGFVVGSSYSITLLFVKRD